MDAMARAAEISDETQVCAALETANANVLRVALYQATGDPDLARMKVVDTRYWNGAYDVAAIGEDDARIVREKAFAYLTAAPMPPVSSSPTDPELRRLMAMFLGRPVEDALFHLGKEELRFDEFPRGSEWSREPANAVKQDARTLIVGAGASGMITAIQLDRLGIPYDIVERNEDVGGTWLLNDYPDARVDMPSHHYQLSFVKNHPWKHFFAPQQELRDYLDMVADRYDLRKRVRFHTEVAAARWDEARATWQVTLKPCDGAPEQVDYRYIISAAGLFNALNLPDFPGMSDFEGRVFHTNRWDHGYDYAGRKVGLVGVGSTGAQIAPRLAKSAGKLTIFQRSPQWVTQIDGYRSAIPAPVQTIFDIMPHYWNWYCFALGATLIAGGGDIQEVDPQWQAAGGRINERNDMMRENLVQLVKRELADRPDLQPKCMPDWPPFAKRPVVDNGWYEALRSPHVDLVTEPIERFTRTGIVTADGAEHELDLLVLGVGFKTERYLWPTEYVGRDGLTLEKAWATDGARAHLGSTVPGFPNLFIIYGPNMQARAGGLFTWLEIWSRYAVKAIVRTIEQGKRVIEVRQAAHDGFNRQLDEAGRNMVWDYQGLRSYYVNEQGRQGVNNPLPPLDYYAMVREPDLADFELR